MSQEVLDRHWQELLVKANVLNLAVATKFKNGQDTGIKAIVVYVTKKVSEAELTAEHLIPQELEGVPTDVVEFAPTTWKPANCCAFLKLFHKAKVKGGNL